MQTEVLRQAGDVPEVEAAAGPVPWQHHHGGQGLVSGRDSVHELLLVLPHGHIPNI